MSSSRTLQKIPADLLIKQIEKHIGVKLKEAELNKPTTEVLKPVLEAMLLENRERLQRVADLVPLPATYPEAYEDALPVIQFHAALTRFMRRAGFESFTLRDLYAPTRERTFHMLHCACNYIMYMRKRMEENGLMKAREEVEPRIVAVGRMQETAAELREVLRQLHERQEQEQAEADSVVREVQEVLLRVMELSEAREGLEERRQMQLGALRDREKEIMAVKEAAVDAKQEAVMLRGQIVESPERLEHTLEELQASIQQREQDKAAVRDQLQGLRNRREQAAKALRKVNKVQQLVQKVHCEVMNKKKEKQRSEQLAEELKDQRKRTQQLEMQCEAEAQAELAGMDRLSAKASGLEESKQGLRESAGRSEEMLAQTLRAQAAHETLLAEKRREAAAVRQSAEAAREQHLAWRAEREQRWRELYAACLERRAALHSATKPVPHVPTQPKLLF